MKGLRIGVGLFAVLVALVLPVTASGEDRDFQRWESAVEARGIDPDDVIYPFAANPEMKRWAYEQMEGAGAVGALERLKILQRALFDRENFEFEYDGVLTLTAEDAFVQRRGNCMAFTALFISLGRALGIPTVLVSVKKVPDVEQVDGLIIVNRHVVAGYRGPYELNLFDFYVTSSAPPIHQRILNDVRASAMHHTNLGSLALREDDLDEARRHFELSTRLAPDWAPGWVNLGVVEYREGRIDEALRAHGKALEAESDNSSALANIAGIHRDLGHDEAAKSALAAAARHTQNPFTLIAMADIEIHYGNLSKARSYLRRARWWFSSEPEVYVAMARLARADGDHEAADRYRLRAEKLREAEAKDEGGSVKDEG